RLPGGPHRAHGGGPDRRFGRVSYLRHGGTATPGPGHRDRSPLHHGRDVEQLLPAVDHDPRPRLVPVDPGTERMERAGVHRGRRGDLPPGHHRFPPDHRAADRGVPVAPALLAVRPGRGQPQGLTLTRPPRVPRNSATHTNWRHPPMSPRTRPSRRAGLSRGLAVACVLGLTLSACGSEEEEAAAVDLSPADVEAALEEGGELTVWAWEPTLEQVAA